MALLNRPPTTVRQTAAGGAGLASANAAGRIRSKPTASLLGDKQMSSRQEHDPFTSRSLWIAPCACKFTISLYLKVDRCHDFQRLGVDEFDTRRRFLKQQNTSQAVGADRVDLGIMLGKHRSRELCNVLHKSIGPRRLAAERTRRSSPLQLRLKQSWKLIAPRLGWRGSVLSANFLRCPAACSFCLDLHHLARNLVD